MDTIIRDIAEKYAEECYEEQAELLRTLGRIPSPTRQEDQRAEFVRDWLLANGADDVTIDEAKNVVCKIGPQDGDLIVFAAHTDIVFPDTEPLPMREEDGIIYAPGIGDDTANLVNLMMATKYILKNDLTGRISGSHAAGSDAAERCGLLIVANACEEGLGNLDGTKALFRDYGDRIRAFYSFDCYIDECISSAVGSYRYKITCRTRGGHSYTDFGEANAIEILCRLVEQLYRIAPPRQARTTYNVGVMQGGTTINSIPQEAYIMYEFRSTSQACLDQMEQSFREAIDSCSGLGGELSVELLGIRPGNGPIDPDELAAFTQKSYEAIQTFCPGELDTEAASTDSNIPLSMGIPANTIGTVKGDLCHTREEWAELASLTPGLKIVMSLMLQYVDLR